MYTIVLGMMHLIWVAFASVNARRSLNRAPMMLIDCSTHTTEFLRQWIAWKSQIPQSLEFFFGSITIIFSPDELLKFAISSESVLPCKKAFVRLLMRVSDSKVIYMHFSLFSIIWS